MANLGMGSEVLLFDAEGVEIVGLFEGPGNYALGFMKNNSFCPKYVGRSDSNLYAEVKQRLNTHGHHRHFKFSDASSPKAAFLKECQNYHDFVHQLENKVHPARPKGSDWKCPACPIFEDLLSPFLQSGRR